MASRIFQLLILITIELLLILQPSTPISTKSQSISSSKNKNLKISRGTIAKFLYNNISQSSWPIIEYHPIDKATISVQESTENGLKPIFIESNVVDTFKYVPSTNPNEYRVVQFYDSNRFKCPDCVYFKEHYVKLALRIKEILQSSQKMNDDISVSFYAISCPHYQNLCIQQKANSNVPIIRLYRAGSQVDMDGIEINYHSIHPFQLIDRLGIRDKLSGTQFLDAHSEFEADWRVGSEIEEKRHYLHNTNAQKINNNKHHGDTVIVNKKDIDKVFPKIAAELEHDINKVIDNMLRNYIHEVNIPKPTSDPEDVVVNSKQPYLPVSDKNQHHLHNLLVLLRKTLPQAWQPLHQLLQDILDNMTYVVKDREYLIQLLDEHTSAKGFVVKKDWSQYCTLISKQLPKEEDDVDDSHSCGFWQFLQTISVGMVEWNQIAYDGAERIQPDTIMIILTNFFLSFNGGGFDIISSSTLQYMYSTCAHDGCNRLHTNHATTEIDDGSKWIEFSLWMNEMRNYFNIQTIHRIAYNKRRRPSYQEEIVVQRPTVQECPRCWQNDSDITDSKSVRVLLLNDNEMIYRYLKLQYGPQDYPAVLQTIKRQLFAKPQKESTRNNSNESNHHSFHGSNRQGAPIVQVHSASVIILVFVGLLFRLVTFNDSRSKCIRQISSRHLFVDKIA